MPRRILIIVGHPDPNPKRLCRALAEAYAEGAEAAGHRVSRVDLATLDFPLLRTIDEFEHETIPANLKGVAEAIGDAEHLVFVFPLWLGTMPAMLKGFLEQIMRPGFAFAYPDTGSSGFVKTLLKGRSARIVVTMGMPAFFYRAVVSQSWRCWHASQHTQLRRNPAGSRDPVRSGRDCHRRQTRRMDRDDAQARCACRLKRNEVRERARRRR